MTAIREHIRAEQSAAVATDFFDRYRAHDVDGMAELCTVNAEFSYPAFEVWGKQRVVRGEGKVATVGKPIWRGLITAFPDLTNTVRRTESNDDGDVVVEVDISGTQQAAWGFIQPSGATYTEPHLFILHVDEDGLIDSISGYFDNAGICRQLGHTEID
ncbi:nuclear transport factor 2 family protein [Nocardia miyunensis]|uniref:nuclear transport factor 2 family protein n=1 Tax=Nocardia miyunensis TaxID=282684 RepID=UPI0008340371|nr:nuclear transport factor 2 family protein [Nocardia miyunensis]